MAERLSVTTESWRPQRRDSVFDPQMRRMALLAGGARGRAGARRRRLCALSHSPHGVPVIEADSRPLRVKPDNPGRHAGRRRRGADHGRRAADRPTRWRPRRKRRSRRCCARRSRPPARPAAAGADARGAAAPPAPCAAGRDRRRRSNRPVRRRGATDRARSPRPMPVSRASVSWRDRSAVGRHGVGAGGDDGVAAAWQSGCRTCSARIIPPW